MKPVTCLLLAWSTLAWAGAGDLSGHLTAEAQQDTNPNRLFSTTTPDFAAEESGAISWQHAAPDWAAQADYTLAVREYLHTPQANAFVQQGSASGQHSLNSHLDVLAEVFARDREHERPYDLLTGSAGLRLSPERRVAVEAWAGAERFLYRADFPYSFAGPVLKAQAIGEPASSQRLVLLLSLEPRTYNAEAVAAPGAATNLGLRRDDVMEAGLSWSARGRLTRARLPWHLSLSYAFVDQESNSYGQTNLRHRLDAQLAVQLPWRLYLMAEGLVQLAHYPQKIPLTPDVFLVEDEENTNSLVLQLSRPIAAGFDLQLGYAIYQAALVQNGFAYLRQLVRLGVTWRF